MMNNLVRGSSPGHAKFTQILEKTKKIEGATASRFRHAFLMAKVSKSGGLDVHKPLFTLVSLIFTFSRFHDFYDFWDRFGSHCL